MGLRKGQNNGAHGVKGKSGRKPKAFTLLKRRIEAEKQDDAEYAFTLYASVMRDKNAPLDLRLDCADWVASRVLGKPTQPLRGDGESPLLIQLNAVDYRNGLDTLKPQE